LTVSLINVEVTYNILYICIWCDWSYVT